MTKPIHETIVFALNGALTLEHALLLLGLLDVTTIPKDHDQIIDAVDRLSRFSLTRNQCESIESVKEGLVAQKQVALQKSIKKYEVIASRHDVSPHVAASEKFISDDDAKRWFREKIVSKPELGWDWLNLVRIDQERVQVQIDNKG